MNILQAKQLDLVDYLASLGHYPSKIKGNDHWYLSPLREEKTASFKVDRRQNIWYDHGLGRGGNFIDFGILFHRCSVKELLQRLNNFSFQPQPVISSVKEGSLVKMLAERNITSLSLLRYLKRRRISGEVALKYCREIIFSLHDKKHAAIGFKNDRGGFELRNEWFKGSSSPKTVTTVENNQKNLAVFEGFFDFLSYRTMEQRQQLPACNFLVLNSASFFEKSRPLMERHESVHLFFDNDKTGRELTAQALSWSNKYADESKLYKGHKDLNEWIRQTGQAKKKGLGL